VLPLDAVEELADRDGITNPCAIVRVDVAGLGIFGLIASTTVPAAILSAGR
jgi:hypothetical protein